MKIIQTMPCKFLVTSLVNGYEKTKVPLSFNDKCNGILDTLSLGGYDYVGSYYFIPNLSI